MRRCWVNFQCLGVLLLLIWIIVEQGPIALAIGAGGGVWTFFSLVYHFYFLSPSLWETARYRLKYCLKGPLSKKTTNQPTNLLLRKIVGQGPTALLPTNLMRIWRLTHLPCDPSRVDVITSLRRCASFRRHMPSGMFASGHLHTFIRHRMRICTDIDTVTLPRDIFLFNSFKTKRQINHKCKGNWWL